MRVGIIGAMQVEVSALQEQLKERKDTRIGAFLFSQGVLHGVDVVVCLSGIGKISAAIGTTLLIERYSPNCIINTGTAGGLTTAKVRDIILATEVRHHDVDVTAFGYKIGQQAQQPETFLPNRTLVGLARIVCEKHGEKLLEGLVVSGDAFISNPKRVEWIELNFPNALAVEMEAAAIAQVCHQFAIPFLVLRAISDKAGEGDATSYEKFVAEAGKLSATINMDLLKQLKEQNTILK